MIELRITHTGKGYAPRDRWSGLGQSTEQFPDVAAAKAWIAKRYGKSKKAPMYRDRKDGSTIKVGYVIGYRDCDWSHAPVQKWLAQDWVEFVNVETSTPAGI
jgi:hypothetical protein